MKPRHLVELILLSAIWGASFIFMRIAAPEFGALNTASLRLIIAGITLAPVLFFVSKSFLKTEPNKTRVLSKIALVGFGNSVLPFILFSYAAINIDAGLASIINATTPLWGALFGILILSNNLGRSGWLGLFLGFVGVYVLSQHKLNDGVTTDLLAILAVVTATSLYGLSTNFSKRYLTQVPPLMIASGTMASSGLLMLPILLVSNIDLLSVSIDAWLAIIALGTLSTGFAYILFYRLIDDIGAIKAMMVTYLIPIFGVVFGHLFLAEPLYVNMFFGGLLILFGVMLTTGLINKRPE